MKTLEHQTLLYDEDCPLCQAYTSGFIKTGMLDENGRKSFAEISTLDETILDVDRASNEIALIDNRNNTVTYGIDSLLKVIGHRFPIIKTIGNIPPIHFALRKLYSFISYNRKVIMPNPAAAKAPQCVPSFNLSYRVVYIVLTVIAATFTVHSYMQLFTWTPKLPLTVIGVLTLGLIGFQGLFIAKRSSIEVVNYIGHLMTVSTMGVLLLILVLLLNTLLHIPEFLNLHWFVLTIVFMFAEHVRRVSILKLPKYLSLMWILYRCLVLITLLILFL
ncbi:DCC1-like thiol-disulfide oxidoreductase family protein [Psychroserpens sp.]|uniref:DCC1-like thiol-disulfide oxidoreductase family protein n=1 Tax=Psychroserpens sp. TaxID=2020870 RepID=UPI001B2DEEC7|nr:DCC1-like thiol-disulfide oxidoreductase family protein [Psychroserpens sp.]MBO6606181.1 DUF393 domain-containing protein [Psychroserpens sp.]MBO6631951.1 DUF393 domain-containing protein [Psychroserpens sp.]MBO6652447.1 DUF393 domain-containing protein [Psychroserpens sp.]MBO6681781.1 DUF393 domain-containing protein [Psychroserpens sp.]MBO6749556.1 DUF393 domain-containing protein [Psychroserpens sp.]